MHLVPAKPANHEELVYNHVRGTWLPPMPVSQQVPLGVHRAYLGHVYKHQVSRNLPPLPKSRQKYDKIAYAVKMSTEQAPPPQITPHTLPPLPRRDTTFAMKTKAARKKTKSALKLTNNSNSTKAYREKGGLMCLDENGVSRPSDSAYPLGTRGKRNTLQLPDDSKERQANARQIEKEKHRLEVLKKSRRMLYNRLPRKWYWAMVAEQQQQTVPSHRILLKFTME